MRGEGSTTPLDERGLYPDAVVSLWRLDLEGREAEKLLCVGVLMRSNWILIPYDNFEKLLPLNTIGFFTGHSFDNTREMENSVIIDELRIERNDKFTILVVSTWE